MKKNFKEFFKTKKAKVIAGALTLSLVLGIGTLYALNNKNEKIKKVEAVILEEVKKDDKKEEETIKTEEKKEEQKDKEKEEKKEVELKEEKVAEKKPEEKTKKITQNKPTENKEKPTVVVKKETEKPTPKPTPKPSPKPEPKREEEKPTPKPEPKPEPKKEEPKPEPKPKKKTYRDYLGNSGKFFLTRQEAHDWAINNFQTWVDKGFTGRYGIRRINWEGQDGFTVDFLKS